jgi:hypothetical protein
VLVRPILVRLSPLFGSLLLLLVAAPASGQATERRAWGVGASIGLVNDVSEDWEIDGFEGAEFEGWAEYRLIDRTILRVSHGSVRPQGDIPEPEPGAPDDVVQRISYWTIGANYQFWEGDYVSGIFGGLGLYDVDTQRTQEDTWGWHFGVEGDLVLTGGLSLVGRLGYHWIDATPKQQFVRADAGLTFRF